MHCTVINLPRDALRMRTFLADWRGPHRIHIAHAIDGSACKLPSRWHHEPGAYGLFATYLGCFAAALSNERTEPFAIFEDDAMFADGWWDYAAAAVAEAPPGWWFINLGADIEVPGFDGKPVAVSDHLARMPHGWRTHAVIYNPHAVPALLDALCANPIPVDQVWCSLMLNGATSFYCTRHTMAGSHAGTSTITGLSWDRPFVGPLGLGQPQHSALLEGTTA